MGNSTNRKKPSLTPEDPDNVSLIQPPTNQDAIEAYLNIYFKFRFNTVKGRPEFKKKSESLWKLVDEYTLNSFVRDMKRSSIKVSGDAVLATIISNFSPLVNPVKDYFTSLPAWDKKDHFKALCDTVIVTNPEKWEEYLKKWMVGVIANALDDLKCKNHVCLVLTGEQGKFKTSWLENLCPKSLLNYLFTGNIQPKSKDTLTSLAEFLYINIDDQLRQLNRQDENELKNYITMNIAKYRRLFQPFMGEYPHLASFMASVNGNDFLTDITGSRRFLPFQVLDIDIQKAQDIDMDKVYSQLFALFTDNFIYWFNDTEIHELHKNNEAFRVVSIEEELLMEYYDVPHTREEGTHFLTTSVIKAEIERSSFQKLSMKKLGEALTKLDFPKYSKKIEGNSKHGYSVIKKEGALINSQNEIENPIPPF